MGTLSLLGTGWTVWQVARRRVGPVGSLVVTVGVLAGLVYVRPWLAERLPGTAEEQ